ncbi:hypothetical protein E3N88_09817 [Mikania micrantha]|uniref:Uncharacterized protein n=1 Tax=Mikania micrantha TaxID=192012 RepID=A0A5N6PM55_9ASTR|nr:hypothetical protein E3N88_09817 [Mikania micrantha]
MLGPDVGALAKASGLIAIGYQMQEVYLKGFARNVNKAAELLESIGKLESVASCFCDLGDFKRARTIFFSNKIANLHLLRKGAFQFYFSSCILIALWSDGAASVKAVNVVDMACRAYVKFDRGAQKVAKFSFANSSLQLRFFY